MPTHHLASSPPWPPRARYKSNSATSFIDNPDQEKKQTVDDFEGPGVDNEVAFLSFSNTIFIFNF